jgi:hypothetical protein
MHGTLQRALPTGARLKISGGISWSSVWIA